jgi:hypothetical protein
MNNLNHVDSLRIDPQSNQSDDVRLSMALRRIRFAVALLIAAIVLSIGAICLLVFHRGPT